MMIIFPFFTTLLMGLSTGALMAPPICAVDYSPCKCVEYSPRYVSCKDVNMSQVQNVFDHDQLYQLDLSPNPMVEVIPSDVLVNATSTLLDISCPSNSSDYPLVVEPDAFRSTKLSTESVKFSFCRHEDFRFLDGFDQLDTLLVYYTKVGLGPALASLPYLPNLQHLGMVLNHGLDDAVDLPPLSPNKLRIFTLSSNYDLTVQGANRLLGWVSTYAAESLFSLSLNDYDWTEIPSELASFTGLRSLYCTANNLTFIGAGTLPVMAKGSQSLFLSDNQLASIEPGAFQGDFSGANLWLDNNKLRRFDSSVFLPVLQQPASKVYINVDKNPFDCTEDVCHLAWLIRDHPEFLPRVQFGACSNGTKFEQLDPDGFSHCS